MRKGLLAFCLPVLLLVGGCTVIPGDRPGTDPASTGPAPPAGTSSTSAAPASPSTTPPSTASASAPTPTMSDEQARLSRMTLRQKVGQLFMVGASATGPSAAARDAISTYHVGNVMLTGRSVAGTKATRKIVTRLQDRATEKATSDVPLFVATDQEGGKVQVLSGPGFSTIPSALTQGRSSAAELRRDAERWGGQLAAAGVNVNLGPVMDTVPSAAAASGNKPIGFYQREFGYTPATVSSHGTAFSLGMLSAGVLPVVKHFPGLGRVAGNTDVSTGVTDRTTTAGDPYLKPYRDAVRAGVPFVMMSTAYYAKIDSADPAAFSRKIVTGMLRQDLGFRGVVISDDLGSAKQVSGFAPGTRATRFIDAGGDVVLTVDSSRIPAMTHAVMTKAEKDEGFAQKVDAAALRVLAAKQRLKSK